MELSAKSDGCYAIASGSAGRRSWEKRGCAAQVGILAPRFGGTVLNNFYGHMGKSAMHILQGQNPIFTSCYWDCPLPRVLRRVATEGIG